MSEITTPPCPTCGERFAARGDMMALLTAHDAWKKEHEHPTIPAAAVPEAQDGREALTSGRYLIAGDLAEGREKSLVGSGWLLDLMDAYDALTAAAAVREGERERPPWWHDYWLLQEKVAAYEPALIRLGGPDALADAIRSAPPLAAPEGTEQ